MRTPKFNRKFLYLVVLTLIVTLNVALVQPATAATGTLTYYPDWQSGNAQTECAFLGYAYGTKVNDPIDGTYPLDQGFGSFTLDWNASFDTVDWSATIGIDAVIMKAGNAANVYSYAPESSGDTQLVTPNNASGGPAKISHITFCYDFELDVSKTANTEWFKKYEWTITKSVDPAAHVGFAGNAFNSTYTVAVDQTVTEYGWRIYGEITIKNPTPWSVKVTVEDEVNGGVGAATVTCPTDEVASGGEVKCTYEVAPGGTSGTLNTVTVTSKDSRVGGDIATAPVTWGNPTIVGKEEINVTDTFNGGAPTALGPANADKTFATYDRPFECPKDPTLYVDGKWTKTYPNTATIVETQQSADAKVEVTCYIPIVSKTADSRYNRDWTWKIVKSADQTELTLTDGQVFDVNYEIEVSATPQESDFTVYGQITVKNPNPSTAMTVDLADSVGGASATITPSSDCAYAAGKLTIPAGGAAVCDYTVGLGAKTDGKNTATITLNGINFDASADYAFGDPANETDECVDVTDDYGTPSDSADDKGWGNVCATLADSSETFTYVRQFGPYSCTDADQHYEIVNTASFVTNDTPDKGSDDHTVKITVPACQKGCTLTQGYWKTHSSYGPAPYDDTWAQIGENTIFFLSGKSYYEILMTAPAGNVYYNLAHQYIAAQLNKLNGADFTAAQTAFDRATILLGTYTPDQVAAMKPSNSVRKEFVSLAATLDNYNNGIIGPGHCSEEIKAAASETKENSNFFVYLPAMTSNR